MSESLNEENEGIDQVMLESAVPLLSSWQLIFLQSKANNGPYDGDRLPLQNWNWPQETWLQKRLRYLRKSHDSYPGKLTD
jgi:hypothetical protein